MVVLRGFGRVAASLAGAVALQGCASINPARVSPMALPTSLSAATCPAPALMAEAGLDSSVAVSHAINSLMDHSEQVRSGLPAKLRDDKVMRAVIRLLLNRRFIAMRSLAPASSRDMLDRAIAATRPERLSHADFEAFHHAILSPNGDVFGRVVAYESDYFNGTFFDRFGSGLTKPALSAAVTDQQIAGLITALIEAVADELLFGKTPVWIGKSSTGSRIYYPGASGDMPSALAYKASPAPTQDMAPDDKGCGMTTLKARVLTWLSGQAATWAAGEAGLIMGAFGGVNAGPVIVLGKLSIGDNKLLLTIVQTVLSTAARRGVFETTWPLLLRIDQPGPQDSVKSIVDQIDFR
jgi:hypothetical protein